MNSLILPCLPRNAVEKFSILSLDSITISTTGPINTPGSTEPRNHGIDGVRREVRNSFPESCFLTLMDIY